MSGKGRVELHDLEGGFRSVDLLPGRYLQFPPGVLHSPGQHRPPCSARSHGQRRSGREGRRPDLFRQGRRRRSGRVSTGSVRPGQGPKGSKGALDRRDAAIRAYMGLVELWTKDQPAYYMELARFIRVHMQGRGPPGVELRPCRRGRPDGLGPAVPQAARIPAAAESEEAGPVLHVPSGSTTLGMCGILRPVTGFESRGAGQGRRPGEIRRPGMPAATPARRPPARPAHGRVTGPRSSRARKGPAARDRCPPRPPAPMARLLVALRTGLGPERPDPGRRFGRLIHLRRRGLRL